ncbi:MAG: hypothetical protein HUU38_03435 [Anaerolineales bacterium]|nr:hypothetical protein [Anaerolineales bacterium]
MNITRDVITDLLPVYLSGEASEDTRALVETFFQQDPAFAELVRAQPPLDILPPAPSSPGQEKETLQRIKNTLRLRSILFGLALFCTLSPFIFSFGSDEGVKWWMIRDAPQMALTFGLGAVFAWGAYAWTFRTLRE